MTWQVERINCPFCKDPVNGGVDVKLESNGQHSTEYPDTPQTISLCGGCTDTEFTLHAFSFHRCPRCRATFLEPFGPQGNSKEAIHKYIEQQKAIKEATK